MILLLTPKVTDLCSRVAFTFFSQLDATCTAYHLAMLVFAFEEARLEVNSLLIFLEA